MSAKCFNAQEFVKEDLLCHFRFSQKGFELVGDLEYKMSIEEMVKSFKESKSKAETLWVQLLLRARRKERGRNYMLWRRVLESARVNHLLQNLPQHWTWKQKDLDSVARNPDTGILEAVGLHLLQSCEAVNRLSREDKEVVLTKHSMDGVLNHHNELMGQLEELRAQMDEEKMSLMLEIKAIELKYNL
ncbi:hypothetical protein F511_39662 [Dorcoceras hygrometricum]|uniref:Uncharacterized protein n=1 Tax=Dorcoceras hygrometricum TaxID=472368 RepID=A0A2Z7CZ84_9LAMI|nr:hypothetical protein F511_39662 [Dorcoceras hygrometricum]